MDEESEAVKSKAPLPCDVHDLNACCYQTPFACFAVLGRDIGGFNFDLFRRYSLCQLCLCSFVRCGMPCVVSFPATLAGISSCLARPRLHPE